MGRVVCALLLAVALAACTHGASSVATQSPTPSGPETPPPPRTVVINKGGTHVYPLSKVAPGDKVVCIAGGGGGVVPAQGEGVGASSGFRAWTGAGGRVHVTCPFHGSNV